MIALIQRVFEAEVSARGSIKSKIGEGLVVYIGIDQNDTLKDISYIQKKIMSIRLFSKESDKFDLSLNDLNLEILIISNFTLNAKTRNGNRPDFSNAKSPKEARKIYELFVSEMKKVSENIKTGEFGENMKVLSANNGPVNILIDSEDQYKPRSDF
mgnify:FL=1